MTGENGRDQQYTLRNDRHWVDSDCENQCFYKLEGGIKLSDASQHSSIFNYFPGDKTTWEGEDSGFCFDPGDCDCRTDTPIGPYPPPTVSFLSKLLII